MKAKVEVPDDLYRQAKAESGTSEPAKAQLFEGQPVPSWFRVFKKYADRVTANDMDSIRRSIAAGISKERDF